MCMVKGKDILKTKLYESFNATSRDFAKYVLVAARQFLDVEVKSGGH